MSYDNIARKLKSGEPIVIDGGTGTELEKRGLTMDPNAWCGPATVENTELLTQVHMDYIAAGAEVITVNTYASNRLMLEAAGYGDRVEEINRTAVKAALDARERSGKSGIAVAGSLSHMTPVRRGTSATDPERSVSAEDAAAAFSELAMIHKDNGCDVILLEMMYDLPRMPLAYDAAKATGLPVWAGLSAKRGEDGLPKSFVQVEDLPFEDVAELAASWDVDAIGTMHTPSNLISECNRIIRDYSDKPLLAYPDSGYFKMPYWQFENVISPDDLATFTRQWRGEGTQIVGGCCGLSPEHIQAMAGAV